MTNTTEHAEVFSWKHVLRFPDTEFMTPAEVLEHRLLTVPGIVGADVGPMVEIEGGEAYCTITITRASGYTHAALEAARDLIMGIHCCPEVEEASDDVDEEPIINDDDDELLGITF